jgi:hypothetical protein
MLLFKPYYYYAKNDVHKEVIDRIIASSYYDALNYFVSRKQLEEVEFLKVYEMIEDEVKSK